jgi:hypothetical protein
MPDLSYTALRYAAGDLDSVDEAAFEQTLAADPHAQSALCEAVRLSAAAAGQPEPRPDSLSQTVVAERLRPTLLSRFLARRPYRGHPMTWTAIGASAAIGLVAVTGTFDRSVVVKPAGNPVPESTFVVNEPTKKDAPKVQPIAVGGGDNDARPINRPATFLPEPPMLTPMGVGDG